MNLNNHEKSSKYIRFSHTVRVIALTLLITLSSSQIHNCYASLNAIEYNTNQTAQNTASIDTKLSNIYTALSTLYSYLSNNGNGVREVLGYIYNYEVSSNSYLYNMWTTMNNATYGTLAQGIKLNDIDTSVLAVGGQVADVSSKLLTSNGYLSTMSTYLSTLGTIDWINSGNKSIRSFGNAINNQNLSPSDNTALSIGTYYARLSEFTYSQVQQGTYASIWRFDLPFRASSLNKVNDLVSSIELVQSDGTPLNSRVYYTYEYSGNFYTLRVYVYDFRMPHSYPDSLYFKITFANTFFYRNDNLYAYYLKEDTLDNYLVAYFGLLEEIKNKDFTAEIDGTDINVNINDSVNVTPIELDVQIGINDFTEVNTISNKLRTWLSTGVGVSALIGALDQLDDSFFTLYNRNVIETINSGYTDFYD